MKRSLVALCGVLAVVGSTTTTHAQQKSNSTSLATEIQALAAGSPITLTQFSTPFNEPIGIDFREDPSNTNGIGDLVLSANWPTGLPTNLDVIQVPSGTSSSFSTLKGLTEELKIATARTSDCVRQFPAGDVFTGTGKGGEIVRVAKNGTIYPPAAINPGGPLANNPGSSSWVQLPNEIDLLRGSLYVDRACSFGGDLIVVTGSGATAGGDVWQVEPSGAATKLATICKPGTGPGPGCVPVHLEGALTLPNDPVKYGPWAGTILAGEENDPSNLVTRGRVWSITPAGVVTPYELAFTDTDGVQHPMKAEDLDPIEPGQNFFGVAYADQRVLKASKDDLAPFVGDVLFTQEFPCGSDHPLVTAPRQCVGLPLGQTTSGLYAVRFVGTGGNAVGGAFNVVPFAPGGSITKIRTWEHVTMAPLGDPHLKITKSPKGATFNIGDPLSFTIVVTSDGAFPANNVVLTDPLPTTGGLTWSVTSVTPSQPCSIDSSQVLNCNFGSLDYNQSVEVVVTSNNQGGAPAASCTGQKLNNIATADADNTDPPVSDTGDYTCPPGSYTLVKTPDAGTYNIGDNINFTMVVTSTGPGRANNVVLNDPLPALGSLNSWTITTNPGGACTITANVLNCPFGNLVNGQTRTVVVATNAPGGADATACPGGRTFDNTATVTGTGLPTLLDTGGYTCTPPRPSVEIVKSTNGVDANDPNAAGVPNVAPGGVVTWTYRVTNTGNVSVPRADVSVSDNTTGVTPTFASEGTGNGDTVLDPGEVWLYSATGTALDLTMPAPSGVTTVPNSCTAGGTQPPRTAYTNVGKVTIPGATATDPSSYCNPFKPPKLKVVKTPDHGTFEQGEQISYQIVVSNPARVGAGSATNVQLADTLPTNGGLTWMTVTATQGTCALSGPNNGSLSCSLGTIAPQGSVTVTVTSTETTPIEACTYQPNKLRQPGAPSGGAYAFADGDLKAADSGSLSCEPPPPPNVKIKKWGNGRVKLGETARFTIKVTNVGPGSAEGVVVTDALPGGFVWTDDQDACTITSYVMTCDVGTMTEGAVFKVILTAEATARAFECNCRKGKGEHRTGSDPCKPARGEKGGYGGGHCPPHKRTCIVRNTAVVTATNEDQWQLYDNSSTGKVTLVRKHRQRYY